MSDVKPNFDLADAMAVKAVFSGEATPEQQRHAMIWIVRGLCRAHTLSWDESSQRWTDFMAGRRWVGLECEYYLTATPNELRKESARRRGEQLIPTEGNEHG